jgi:Mn-containing catalase
MYYVDKRLQYPVRVENPDPLFARQLQQAIGGIEGEIRVCLQYFFQAWGARGPSNKYRDVLLNTATEEMGHIEMLATAVALNLENAPLSLQESAAEASPVLNAVMGGGERSRHAVEGMLQRHLLSTGLRRFPQIQRGCPSIARISTQAVISRRTCIVTSLQRRPAGRSPFASTIQPTIRE